MGGQPGPDAWVLDGRAFFAPHGQEWKEPLENLESESLSDRTFATARTLAEALAQRARKHADLPALRVAIMERHVERAKAPPAGPAAPGGNRLAAIADEAVA